MPFPLFDRLRQSRVQLAEISRIDLWWENKLSPILAAMYGTAVVLDVSLSSMWRPLLAAVVAISAQAVYTSVINDLTDRDVDSRAGKPNRLANRSRHFAATVLCIPLAVGIGFAVWWRSVPVLVVLYAAGWISFFLYSVPPFRFKQRGLAGLVADACGAHLFPTLVGVLLVYHGADREIETSWPLVVAGWAFACGLRNNLCHQISDRGNDVRIGIETFAARHRPEWVVSLGVFVIFPLELVALGLVLLRLGHPLPVVALGAYALLAFLRLKLWGLGVVIVEPKPRSYIALHSYYEAFFPVSLLLVSITHHPADLLVLAAQLTFFRRPATEVVLNAWTMIKMPVRKLLRS